MAERNGSQQERLFLVDSMPDGVAPPFTIKDTYLSIEESRYGLHVVRVRYRDGPANVRHKLRVDHGSDRVVTDISKDDYEKLRVPQYPRTIHKKRHMYREGVWSTGIDVYEGDMLGGLALAGVRPNRFNHEPVEDFNPYEWMGEEVTNEPSFLDHRLVRLDEPPFGETELAPGRAVDVQPLK